MDFTPVPTDDDVQVNTFTNDVQLYPSVAALTGGGFVVTWSSNGQDGSGYGIYGQRYSADGTPLGSEFPVNVSTTNDQLYSSVAALNGGGFVVTWASNGQDGSDWGIYGQRYSADGTPLGSEFPVNTVATYEQANPSVTALAGGGFVVTWSSYQDGSSLGIYGQRYSEDGTPLGSEFPVNTYTIGQQDFSCVTALGGGGFVVTWSSNGQDGNDWGIYGQRFAADGSPAGIEFRVNTFTPKDQNYSSVAGLAAGGFVVTWMSYDQDGSVGEIYGQRFALDGTRLGVTADAQNLPSATALIGGGFLVTWTSNGQDGSGQGIYGQRFAADGTAIGAEFRINQITAGNQVAENYGSEAVAMLPNGRLVQVWSGQGTEEVFFRLIEVPLPDDGQPSLSPVPTGGPDEIAGADSVDAIAALAGDDVVWGFGASDLLFGNQGSDTLHGGTGDDTLVGGGDNDLLQGEHGNDLLFGNEGADTLAGGEGSNTIVGGQDSTDAADLITSGSGNDFLLGNGGADTISSGSGNNTLVGGFGSDQITAGSGDDLIWGNQDSDSINAGDGANIVWGGFGDDSIIAGAGNDTLWGNEGNDSMSGGGGADRYVFAAGSGTDQISGFSFGEGDRLDVQAQAFTVGASGDGDVLLMLAGGGTVELNGVGVAGFSSAFVV